jgi:putative photosynthetic complex assembly protein 2
MSLVLLPERSLDHSALGALLGFGQGLALWAWLEMTYLMGVVTGPRKAPCPEDAPLGRRFWLGLQTSLYHELAVIAVVLSVLFLSAGGPNQVAAATCVSLWLMRWSAKLNLFLGVRNYNSDWFPEHLQYLDSYTRRAHHEPAVPVSVASAMATTDPFLRAADLLVSALLSLAVLEHWFLVYPFGESALWRWALPQADEAARAPRAEVHNLSLRKSLDHS